MGFPGAGPARPRLPRSIRLTIAALATLAGGLLGVALLMLTGPDTTDPMTTSIRYALLYAVAGLVVLTVAMLRGRRGAWLLTCLLATFFWLAPVAFVGSEIIGELRRTEEPMPAHLGTFRSVRQPSLRDSVSEALPWMVIGGGAASTVLLLLPATRRDLRRMRGRAPG